MTTCRNHIRYNKPLIFFFSPFRTYRTRTSSAPIDPLTVVYLTRSLGLSVPKALSIYQSFPGIRNLEKTKSVVQFLKSVGCSDHQVCSAVKFRPQILCSHIDKTLRPRVQLFQDLGFTSSDLGKLLSSSSQIFAKSLDKKVLPCIQLLKKVLVNDRDLLLVLTRSNWIFGTHPEKVLKANVSFLMECGIVGSHLSMTLKRQPWILTKNVSELRDLVSKVLDMGFSINSTFFIHAMHTINSMTNDTLMRKFELFKSFGFSDIDCADLFRKMPVVFRASVEKLKIGLLFYLNTVKVDKITIVRNSVCLMYSMENRVIPRYKVVEILKSKKLLKKKLSFLKVVCLTEVVFLDKFISRFPSNAEELLVAYNERSLESSEGT